MTSRNPPSAAFWATVGLVVALVAYPLSFGPACWIASRANVGASAIPVVYRPLTRAMSPTDGHAFTRLSEWYAEIGAADGWGWVSTWSTDNNPDGTLRLNGQVAWTWAFDAGIPPPW